MLLLKDLKFMVKKNVGIFIILIAGLLFISTLSMLLTENLRNEFFDICEPDRKERYLTFKYEEPIETSEIMDVIEKHSSGIYSLYLVTETAYLNSPYYYDMALGYEPWEAPSESLITAPDEPGLVGYLESEYVVENVGMLSGKYPDFTKTEVDAAIITKSLESFVKNDTISAQGNDIEISGMISDYTHVYLPFSERNILTSISNYEKLEAETVIVLVYFYNYPTKNFLNSLSSGLDSLGSNVNTSGAVSTFSLSLVANYIFSVLKYIIILVLAFATLILTFSCWLSSQQSLYSVYYICGMTESKAVMLRLLQIILLVTPTYIVSVFIYIILTEFGYKTITYEISPVLIVINYIVIVLIASVMSLIQNKNINGYDSLKNI